MVKWGNHKMSNKQTTRLRILEGVHGKLAYEGKPSSFECRCNSAKDPITKKGG